MRNPLPTSDGASHPDDVAYALRDFQACREALARDQERELRAALGAVAVEGGEGEDTESESESESESDDDVDPGGDGAAQQDDPSPRVCSPSVLGRRTPTDKWASYANYESAALALGVDAADVAAHCQGEGAIPNHEFKHDVVCDKPLGNIPGTDKCAMHGGSYRCRVPDCNNYARLGGGKARALMCVGHGGGPRCIVPNCDKASRGAGGTCHKHRGQSVVVATN